MPLPCKRRNDLRISTGTISLLALTLTVAATLPPAVGRADLANRRNAITEAARKAMPSVVSISSEKKAASTARWPFSAEENSRPRVSGMGTGVIIDARGYILTNQHVVDKVQGLEVHLHDGTVLPGRVVQQDQTMDVALVKVEAGHPLPPVVMGTSSDLMVGEDVITIGNAFGYENTTGRGIISALLRNVTLSDDQVYRNLIQTDAPINPGNSGGPLLNVDGELIGINVATRAGAQGIGFALPIDDVKRVAAEMLSTRRLVGTWHGLATSELIDSTGGRKVVVTDVPGGSPAEIAGVRRGDELVRINNLGINNPLDVERSLLDSRPGQRSEMVVRRGGQETTLPLDVQSLPRATPDAGDQVWRLLGLRTLPVTSEYVAAASNKLKGGLYVQSVLSNSPASKAQIQKGDILIGLNDGSRNWETLHPDNVLYVVRQTEQNRSTNLRFFVVRKNAIHQGDMAVRASDGAVANASSTTR